MHDSRLAPISDRILRAMMHTYQSIVSIVGLSIKREINGLCDRRGNGSGRSLKVPVHETGFIAEHGQDLT